MLYCVSYFLQMGLIFFTLACALLRFIGVCSLTWHNYNKTAYVVVDQYEIEFNDAVIYCEEMFSAEMIMIKTEDTQQFMEETIATYESEIKRMHTSFCSFQILN